MSSRVPTLAVLLVLTAVSAIADRSYTDPPRGAHCDCAGGVCPLDANGRGCSCGCAKRADAQPPARLEAQLEATCNNGAAGPYPCRDVDLLSFLPHSEMGGGTGNDIWGWTDPETGREYALVGESTGTAFVDISNPSQPIYVGRLPAHTVASLWRGIKVFANHTFIVSEAIDHGMQVFDLTQLRGVTAPPVTFTETAHYAGFGSTHTLAMNTRTGFAYAAGTRTCEGGLHVVDVRTPATPRAAGCFSYDGYTHETQCVVYEGPDTVYRDREICLNSNEDTLTIVDATNKVEQVQVSRTGYGGSAYTHQGWLTDDHRFFLVNDEGDEQAFRHRTRTWIWDVSDLDAPAILAYYDGPTSSIDHNLYVRGNLVYESNYRSGLRAVVGEDLVFVVRVTNNGPDRRSQIRVIETPPATAQLASARASQGECIVSGVVTCELGTLAPGADAFVFVTIRAATDGDAISSATTSGTSDDRLTTDAIDTLTTTRVARDEPGLTLRRPVSDTLFRLGRNNTVQWTLRGVTGGVSIDLSGDDGATWTRLSEEAENVGFYDWTGSGLVTSRAKIRVTSTSNPALTQTSPTFSIVAR